MLAFEKTAGRSHSPSLILIRKDTHSTGALPTPAGKAHLISEDPGTQRRI
jgi:hypothetical protein